MELVAFAVRPDGVVALPALLPQEEERDPPVGIPPEEFQYAA